jgi:hypothetical protein
MQDQPGLNPSPPAPDAVTTRRLPPQPRLNQAPRRSAPRTDPKTREGPWIP